MMPSGKINRDIRQSAASLLWLLVISFVLACLADYSWIFDLFVNFMAQYMVGGVMLAAFFLWSRQYRHFVLAVAITIMAFGQTRTALDNPWQFSLPQISAPAETITVLQYNHGKWKTDFTKFTIWLRGQQGIDVVVLQEATYITESVANDLADIFEHNVLYGQDGAFGTVVLSKHPLKTRYIPVQGNAFTNMAFRVEIDHRDGGENAVIYVLHTIPPLLEKLYAQRSEELDQTARAITQDTTDNIIFIGDWNLTPYSPVFRKVKQDTGLQYQAEGFLLSPTWPSFNLFNVLKIPIDHTMHGNGLDIISKKVEPTFASDHHAVKTVFGYKE